MQTQIENAWGQGAHRLVSWVLTIFYIQCLLLRTSQHKENNLTGKYLSNANKTWVVWFISQNGVCMEDDANAKSL